MVHTLVVVVGTIIYLLFERVESMLHYGLYDVALLGLSDEDKVPTGCTCASPPCTVSSTVALSALFVAASCVMADFALTLGGCWCEEESVSHSLSEFRS